MSRRQRLLIFGLLGCGLLLLTAGGLLLWQQTRGAADPGSASAALVAGGPPAALRLEVTTTGLTHVREATLRDVGLLNGPLNTAAVALFRDGRPVPYFVGEAESEAALFFYATAITSTLEKPAVYWLEPGAGLAMSSVDAPPTGSGTAQGQQQFRWEENHIFVALADSDDPWFGARLFSPGELSSWETSFTLPPVGGTAQLRLQLWSNNSIRDVDPDHRVAVEINGRPLPPHSWDGLSLERISMPVPAGVLQPGDNQLRIFLPGDTGAAGEDVYLDWVALDYAGNLTVAAPLQFSAATDAFTLTAVPEDLLVLDVGGRQPRLLSGGERQGDTMTLASVGSGRYYAASASAAAVPAITLVPHWTPLRAAERGGDYLVVTADAAGFEPALQPLLDHRRAQGYTTALVNVRQIYDEFGHGRESPAAIRSFLEFATANWTPAPRFVLLVGDASYDVNGYADGGSPNLLPAQLIFTTYAGYVASDTWYVLPESGHPAPYAAVGRLPAQSAADLAIMVEKTLAYENAADNDWQGRAMLVADDEQQFTRVSTALAGTLRDAGYTPHTLHMEENPAIRDDIIGTLNGGVGLVNYVGHGSIGVWGDERVLRTEDAAALRNEQQYPIFVTFTCLNGYFNHPQVDALAEALLRVEGAGVVAAVAPSGRSFTTQQEPIADAFYALLLTSGAETLGEALQVAKQQGADNSFLLEVIHTFNLLGDPALRFRLPPHP